MAYAEALNALNDTPRLKRVLESDPSLVHQRDAAGNTLLFHTIDVDTNTIHHKALNILMEYGSDPTVYNKKGESIYSKIEKLKRYNPMALRAIYAYDKKTPAYAAYHLCFLQVVDSYILRHPGVSRSDAAFIVRKALIDQKVKDVELYKKALML